MKFYVYEHWRPDTNRCFYIGKGNGKRAYEFRNGRNKHYLNVVAKLSHLGLSVEVRIVESGLIESDAFDRERSLISFYGMNNLVNLTIGGEGVSGLKHTPASKTKMSVSAKNKPSPSAETRRKLSEAATGLRHTQETIAGMKILAKKRGMPSAVIEAARRSNLGRKRNPFTPETIAKMRVAASLREQVHRARREGV